MASPPEQTEKPHPNRNLSGILTVKSDTAHDGPKELTTVCLKPVADCDAM